MLVDDHQLLSGRIEKHKAVVVVGLVLDEAPEQRAAEESRIAGDQGLEQLGDGAAVAPVLVRRLDGQGLVVGHGQARRQHKRMGVAAAGGTDGVVAQVHKEGQIGALVEGQGLLEHRGVVLLVLEDADLALIGPGQADAVGVAGDGAVKRRLKGGCRQAAVAVGSDDQTHGRGGRCPDGLNKSQKRAAVKPVIVCGWA